MLNLEQLSDSPVSGHDELVVQRIITAVERNAHVVVHRVKLRLLWGAVRPSYAVRLGTFLPFLRWLLHRVPEDGFTEPPVTEESK